MVWVCGIQGHLIPQRAPTARDALAKPAASPQMVCDPASPSPESAFGFASRLRINI
jgi:hypothetical protein